MELLQDEIFEVFLSTFIHFHSAIVDSLVVDVQKYFDVQQFEDCFGIVKLKALHNKKLVLARLDLFLDVFGEFISVDGFWELSISSQFTKDSRVVEVLVLVQNSTVVIVGKELRDRCLASCCWPSDPNSDALFIH